MKKINSQLVLTGVIITAFCCSFLFFIPITTRSANPISIPTKGPMVSTVSGSSNPTGDEWPMFHHSLNHTGVTETTPVVNANPIWDFTTGNSTSSSPAIVNGRVFVGSDDGYVYCLDATDGTQLWTYPTGASVQSSPAVADGMVYVGSNDGNIYCIDESTGSEIWSNSTGNVGFSSPAVADGMVYVGSNDYNVYCFNASTGDQIWKYNTNQPIISSPAVANGCVYIGNQNGFIYCLNASTGVQIWNHGFGQPVFSSPAVADGMVFVADFYQRIYCLNESTGVQIWNHYTGGNYYLSSVTVADGMVLAGTFQNSIYCLNESTGAQIWNYATGNSVYSSPAVADGMVYVGSNDDNLYCLNESTGTKIWNYATGGSVYSSPAIANGMVYFGSDDNKTYCLPMILGSIPSAPLNLAAIPGNWQVSLSWNVPTDNGGLSITGYNIYRGTSSGSETLLSTVGNVLTFTDTNVMPNTNYYYEVSAINLAGEGPKSSENSTTTPTFTPTAPLSLTATPYNNSIFLTWQVPANTGGSTVTGYNIYRGTSSGSETFLINVSTAYTGYNDTSVTCGLTYYYTISANNSVGEGSQSNEVNGIPTGAPFAPLNLQATSGNYNISLTWQAPSNDGGTTITYYNIYRGDSSGTEVLLTTVGGSTLTYTDTGLIAEHTYYYMVSARNSYYAEGPQSNEVNAAPFGVPSVPLSFTATPGNKNINLTWQAPSDNGGLTITGYNIYRGTSSGTEVLLTSVDANTLTYKDTGLTNGKTYYYEVSANNSAGEGLQSNEVNATPTGEPSVPSNLQATPGNNNITLTWQAPSSNGGLTITGYNIYRGNSSGAEVLLTTIGANTLTYTDMNLTANTTYYYQISAINSAGEGQKSSEISATTNLAPKNKIGGMGIESLLLVSFIGVIAVVLGVKKRLK